MKNNKHIRKKESIKRGEPSKDNVIRDNDDDTKKDQEHMSIECIVHDDDNNKLLNDDVILPSPYPSNCLQQIKNNGNNNNHNELTLLQLAKKTFQRMYHKNTTYKKKNSSSHPNDTSSIEPTPIQLQTWSILDHHPKIHNIIGIAPTGSGKTLGYGIPLLLSTTTTTTTTMKHYVHGIILVPTRELTIQVSKELKIVSKVASTNTTKIQILAIYGGVCKKEQYQSLISSSSSSKKRKKQQQSCSIVIAATPGRLMDLLQIPSKSNTTTNDNKNNNIDDDDESKSITKSDTTMRDQDGSTTATIHHLFQNVHTVVIDEADRMATNTDLANQVDSIFQYLKKQHHSTIQSTYLFSATMPQRTSERFEKWIPKPRIYIKANTTILDNTATNNTISTKQKSQIIQNNSHSPHDTTTITNNGSSDQAKIDHDDDDKIVSKKGMESRQLLFATIPSHVTQILHVCATHKKPKKLLITLSKIRKEEVTRRRQGLCIIFFAKIKTLQYLSKMLRKEGTLPLFKKKKKKNTTMHHYRYGISIIHRFNFY